MSKKISMLAFTFATLLTTAPLLGACHTVAGAGEDISRTGDAIEHTAERSTPPAPR